MEVSCIKKIDPLVYAFIVLELCRDSFRPCPPYSGLSIVLHLGCNFLDIGSKLYIPSTLNIERSEMLNHGLNQGLFFSLFKLIPCPLYSKASKANFWQKYAALSAYCNTQ